MAKPTLGAKKECPVARIRLTLLGIVTMVIGTTTLSAHAAPNPTTGPGNNGTVKIDQLATDDTAPGNQPHVGCSFGLDWYGYDADARTSVEFRLVGGGGEALTANVYDPTSGA